MISEREFIWHFSSFWRDTLPNLESAVRSLNLTTRTEWPQIVEPTDPNRRDLIAETAFETASARFQGDKRPYAEVVEWAENRARSFLNGLVRGQIVDPTSLSGAERTEVNEAQTRIFGFARNLSWTQPVEFHPIFFGHGILSECVGDFRSTDAIVEVKYVQRNFRSNDYRQVLTYAALDYLKSGNYPKSIILLNPYRGTVSEIETEYIVLASGGLNFEEFSVQFSYCVSSGEISR